MATHYVYNSPDKSQLRQGDVLQLTPKLAELLQEFHPHYAKHPEYQLFAITTQSCDLVKREGKPPKTPYIAIAAARTLEETLLREASKTQTRWQKETKVIGERERSTLSMFLQRLFDNNEPGFFYLHADQSLGIHTSCCVVLALAVTLRSEHYELLLDAKIAQLTDTFQAKLGWLIAQMYGRVGTTEWNSEYPDNPLKMITKSILDETLVSVQDSQIKEGLAELKSSGQLDELSSAQIFEHIQNKNILARSKKFEQRAVAVGQTLNLVNLIQARTKKELNEGNTLKELILQLLVDEAIDEQGRENLAEQLLVIFDKRLCQILTDAALPGKADVVASFVRGILTDPQIAALLR